MCCKKAFVLFSERAHTRDSTRVATRVHLTIIERTLGGVLLMARISRKTGGAFYPDIEGGSKRRH